MKKSTKFNVNLLTQSGEFESSSNMNIEEVEQKVKNFTIFWSGVFDFISAGNFSIYRDNYKLRIWKNRIRILEASQELIEKSGLDIKPLDFRLEKEIQDNISYEENNQLQRIWANLLANAATKRVPVTLIFIKILAELSENEVAILDLLRRIHIEEPYVNTDYILLHLKQFDKENIKVSLDVLFSKRLIESPKILGGDVITVDHPIQSNTYDAFWFTPLGEAFVKACHFPNGKESHFFIGSL